MKLSFLHSKVHRVVVTAADPDYEGSLTLDRTLMDAAGMAPYQRIEVYNVSRGTRLSTYLIEGPAGQGDCCLNGAAAHLVEVGDRVIIAAYCELEPEEVGRHRPRLVLVGADNRDFSVRAGETAFTRT